MPQIGHREKYLDDGQGNGEGGGGDQGLSEQAIPHPLPAGLHHHGGEHLPKNHEKGPLRDGGGD